MLYDIEGAATAQNSAILLHPKDNVAVARVAIPAGQELQVGEHPVQATAAIPAGHKVALRSIEAGEPVFRYGNVIGFATRPIRPGDHIHVHNLGYQELNVADLASMEPAPARPSARKGATFMGYQRADGRVGTRNYIAVVAASNCAAYTSELIAASFDHSSLPENVDGVVAFPHGEGCAMSIGPDTDQLRRTLEGVLDHPNVSAALILGLGCEVNQIGHYLGQTDRPRVHRQHCMA
jgi:altronate hydrolase